MLWKRSRRREWQGTQYYLDPWIKRANGDENEARRLRNEYMRSYRAKKRHEAPCPIQRAAAVGAMPAG